MSPITSPPEARRARCELPRRALPRLALATVLVAACMAWTGCSVCHQTRRTIVQEPAAYAWKYDRARSLKLYRIWADEAWATQYGDC
ncbi:MAG TPA: hypothetical protein PKC18_13330, partial [Lacipirellulaceae bacterium]|nr:hypothetical protein [Lacipirellulaceae bacterium]